jgi:hypothetical protein
VTRAEFAESVFTYCAITGASVTSLVRSPAHNADVGGVAGSAHLFGLGADVVYDHPAAPTPRDAIALRVGLRRISEVDHDHLQPLTWLAG